MNKNDGGPAFPTMGLGYDKEGKAVEVRYEGMSLRDWFAGMAISGILGAPAQKSLSLEEAINRFSEASYALADAMLQEREK